MADNLKSIIDNLQRTELIRSNPQLVDTLTLINRYGENNFSKAYLLGLFFKNKISSDHLPSADKNELIYTIKENNLGTYFYLKTKPASNRLGIIAYVFLLGGLPLMITGIAQLINHSYSFVAGVKYPASMILEGGYKLILGLIMFVGGIIQLRYQNKRKKFYKSLTI